MGWVMDDGQGMHMAARHLGNRQLQVIPGWMSLVAAQTITPFWLSKSARVWDGRDTRRLTMRASSRISMFGSDYLAVLVGGDGLEHLRQSQRPPAAAEFAPALDPIDLRG